jgi:phosphoribosylanthranilate isomerase
VCGITSYEDAAMALDCGVDALGFNFYRPSPRYIDPADARAIIRRLPPLITTVGVFVNVEQPADVAEIARLAGVRVLQLHGDETAEYCRRLADWTLIKALRIGNEGVEADLQAYSVQAFLLDSRHDLLFGGTGKAFDWSLCHAAGSVRPLILAGGLGPSNVAQAILTVKPYGVDACSGVESAPGKKDTCKLKAFVDEVRNVRSEIRHGTR